VTRHPCPSDLSFAWRTTGSHGPRTAGLEPKVDDPRSYRIDAHGDRSRDDGPAAQADLSDKPTIRQGQVVRLAMESPAPTRRAGSWGTSRRSSAGLRYGNVGTSQMRSGDRTVRSARQDGTAEDGDGEVSGAALGAGTGAEALGAAGAAGTCFSPALVTRN